MSEFRARQRKVNPEMSADDLENQPPGDEFKKKQAPPRSAALIIAQVLAGIIGTFLLYILIVPSPIDPSLMVKDDPLPYFDGVLEPNDVLRTITKLGVGKLPGPESIQVDFKGNIYTGLSDGRIMKIEKSGAVVELARTGENHPNCGEAELEHKCGRPLGLQLDKGEENLIICDAYLGLLKLNLLTNKLYELIPASVGIRGVHFKFLNALAISSSGKVYFTDSSWKWSSRDLPYIVLEGGGQGRLFSFDMNTNETDVLLDGLFFANGVALSPDEDFVIVTETTHSRIVRVWLKGDRKGIYDIFSDNLPGFPENIRNAKGGGYWLALSSTRKWPFNFLDSIGPYPRIKSLLAKIFPKSTFGTLFKDYGLVLKLDYYGDIVKSYHDPTGGIISHISEAYCDYRENVLYFGSYRSSQDFIGKLRLDGIEEKKN